MAMAVLLAAGLTVGGIRAARGRGERRPVRRRPRRRSAPGAFASAKEVLRDLFGDDSAAPDPGVPSATAALHQRRVSRPTAVSRSSSCWPEVKPVMRLVDPAARRASPPGTPLARPYGIPFDGTVSAVSVCPQRRPPATSILQHGSPAALAFSTVDHWPLNMEAIQKFDEPIDLGCCRAMRVEIWNADRYPDTVTLDLYCNAGLVNSAPVRSKPDLGRDPVMAVPETLEFPVKAPRVCTEFKIGFRRQKSREDKSARIAIERFLLMP